LWAEAKGEQADLRREQSRKSVFVVLWFEEELGNKIVMGARIHGQDFCYKMINKVDE
jgi:hypothetical protein